MQLIGRRVLEVCDLGPPKSVEATIEINLLILTTERLLRKNTAELVAIVLRHMMLKAFRKITVLP